MTPAKLLCGLQGWVILGTIVTINSNCSHPNEEEYAETVAEERLATMLSSCREKWISKKTWGASWSSQRHETAIFLMTT